MQLNGDFVADRNPISHGKIYNDLYYSFFYI